jgi:SAM-dependent methyltransferase
MEVLMSYESFTVRIFVEVSIDKSKYLQDIFQWDVKTWSKALPFWEEHLSGQSSGKAAAFGEREGGLSLWLSKSGFDVICTDYNDFAEVPLKLHVSYGVDDKIDYQKQNITAPTFEDNSFDVVIFKSVIGALGKKELQQKALDELYRILKPGGYLLFAENMEASGLHKYARKKFTNWGHRWRYPTFNEMPEMLRKFSQVDSKTVGFFATFGRSEGQRSFLAAVDKLFSFLVPRSKRYVMVAACKK